MKKRKRWLKRIIIGILVGGIAYCGIVICLISSGKSAEPDSEADTLLILGAQVIGGTADTARPSVTLRERLDTALLYWEQFPAVTIIVCGGQGADEADSEANVMAKYLIAHGVPEGQIIREDSSTRTTENLVNAQQESAIENAVIVTSDFHVYRSVMLAKRLGYDKVSGLPAPSKSSATTKNNIREVAALGYALIFDW